MKKTVSIWLPLTILLMAALLPMQRPQAQAAEKHQLFFEGIRHYQNGDYEAAIDRFLRIAQEGVQNSQLFYNLGNAYLKNNQLGPALLWYERALRLAPNDPDLHFNYNYALSQRLDARDEKPLPWKQIFLFWKPLLPPHAVAWAAIGCHMLFWCLRLLANRFQNKSCRISSYVCLILTVIFTLTVSLVLYEHHFSREGIILPQKVSVRSGLTEDTTELFVLHEGTKVKIERERQEYLRIFFSEGKIGWVSKAAVGVI